MTDFPIPEEFLFSSTMEDEEIRDQFAALAMGGLITRGTFSVQDSEFPDQIAKRSYEIANAMMRVRNNNKKH